MKKSAASLVGLVVKGAATPTPAVVNETAHGDGAIGSTQLAKSASTYFKSLTLKLDEDRYRALKLLGLELGRSSQHILVEALDAWIVTKSKVQ